MPFHLSFEDSGHKIVVKTRGDLTAGEFTEMINDTKELCRDSRCLRVLVDHSLSTVQRISEEQVIFIAGLCETLNDVLTGGKMAVVLVRDVDYGLGRMWLAHTSSRLTYQSRIFRAIDEALEWLDQA